MIDILSIDPSDREAIGTLVDTMRAHCTPAECEQFLSDLYTWDQSIPGDARVVMRAYTRMVRRGAFVPAIVRRHVTVTAGLKDTPEWRAMLTWQTYIQSLPASGRTAA